MKNLWKQLQADIGSRNQLMFYLFAIELSLFFEYYSSNEANQRLKISLKIHCEQLFTGKTNNAKKRNFLTDIVFHALNLIAFYTP